MAIRESTHRFEPALPQNTVVVLPKQLPMNRGALWTFFWAIGLFMGLFLRSILNGPDDLGVANAALIPGGGNRADQQAAAAEQPTMEVHVRAILELPSPTATSTPWPTATATADPSQGADFCSQEEPGKLCRVPFPPPPTPTPIPSCDDMNRLSPGDWCVWPTAGPEWAYGK